MVLPFGAGVTDKPDTGHADGAPTKPLLGLKLIITSLISIALTALLVYLLEHGHLAKFLA